MKKKKTDDMFIKKLVSVVAAIIVLGFIAFLVIKPYLPATENTISVSGSGELSVMPDKAVVHLAVESKTETADEAQKNNTDRINNIIKSVNIEFIRRKKSM